jgi:hypothetical protein
MCLPDHLWGSILAKLVLPCSGYNADSASLRLTCKAMQRLVNQSVTTISLQWIDDGVEAARYPQARRLVYDREYGLQNIAERLASWPPDYHILHIAVSSCKGMQRLFLDMCQKRIEPASLLQCLQSCSSLSTLEVMAMGYCCGPNEAALINNLSSLRVLALNSDGLSSTSFSSLSLLSSLRIRAAASCEPFLGSLSRFASLTSLDVSMQSKCQAMWHCLLHLHHLVDLQVRSKVWEGMPATVGSLTTLTHLELTQFS